MKNATYTKMCDALQVIDEMYGDAVSRARSVEEARDLMRIWDSIWHNIRNYYLGD